MVVLGEKTWFGLLFVMRNTPLSRIWARLLFAMVVATVTTYLHVQHDVLKSDLTPMPFSLIGIALGIFLGFRNNASYDRFWEGRKLWGALVNTCRSLQRQTMTLISSQGVSDAERAALQRELSYRIIGYVHSLRHHLRSEPQPGDALAFVPEEERAALADQRNVPLAMLARLGDRFAELWRTGRVDPLHVPMLEASLVALTDIQGGCERIKSTPIPAGYTILIHRLVASYVLMLPFGLVQAIGVYTPMVVLLVAYAFMGLDAIGDEIEEPFGNDDADLPLTSISRTIEINLRQRLGETDLPAPLEPVNRILR